ncbi:DUF4038 domain-containing protein [Shinella sp.]|uniref:apiosidase-like domain-containing protein n=1 Tax=Shinella sp. TaxID=1870904 RepID=UPI0028AE7214|nr:DUF4038 domain-containing protein [Shinella sp.]
MRTIAFSMRLCLVLLALLAGRTAPASAEVRFPLRIAAAGTYLEDAAGKPFLITGDAAWSLISDLPAEEADIYIADRKARGFNTILVSLIEHEFARNAPNNAADIPPFLVPGDFAQPNDRYFSDAEHVLDDAFRAGMLVLLAPAYAGANGGSQGWYGEMAAASPDALRAYGRYLGKRYARYPNIVWVQGGDYDPPDRALVEALAEGIAEGAPGAMQTVHGNRDTATAAYWPGAGWLALDTVYTYEDVATAVQARYRAGPHRPFFLIEARYEGEHGVEAAEIRKIAYGALLSGASGQVFGNNPVWHFGGPALYDTPAGWREALASRGAESIGHLASLFARFDWWKLKPDDGRFVRRVEGAASATAITAVAGDGTFAVAYIDGAAAIDLDPSALTAPAGTIEWYDPSTGAKLRSEPEADLRRLVVPALSRASDVEDWLVVLRAGKRSRSE